MLDECLSSLADQTFPSDEFEVVVVDNGSTDDTPRWLATWATDDPGRRRVLDVAEPGLSRARNRAAEAARAEVVLYLDDDAIAPRGWVEAHVTVYDREPAAVYVGGPIVLTWPFGRPAWLTPRLEHWFSALDHGDRGGPMSPPHFPYGANMSVRRDHLMAVGGFSERLGRRGRSLMSSGEQALAERCWERGDLIYYEPATLVLHRVLANRINRRWVIKRGWAQGRSNARVRTETGPVGGRDLVSLCLTELGAAVAGGSGVVRLAAQRNGAGVLDELSRRAGHVSGAVEQVWLTVHNGTRNKHAAGI
jgi:glycosyltransferase involved in cell wall biosynthesis